MKLYRLIGACAALALAICAVAASSAFALALEGEGAPEFGRCVKLAKGESGNYSDASCTTKEVGGKYEWKPGPGANRKFTVHGREVETTEASRCLTWHELIEEGKPTQAAEDLKKWKYTEAQCEKVVKAKECFDWLRRGQPLPSGVSYTEAECEAAAKEWEELYLKETVVLETVNGDRVECEKVTASGEYSAANTKQVEGVVAKFTNCVGTLPEAEIHFKCTSKGAAEGEIVTSVLDGELGIIATYENPVDDQVGISLAAASGETVAQFECGPILGGYFPVTVTGSVIHPVTRNKMLLEEIEKFSQKKGLQTPEKFEGGPLDVLKTTLGDLTPEQSGEVLLTTLVNEEEIEVNSVY